MDEVTLDGKIYISSKRAAQITGYAKDYVGQLCREGRVEARLVGRSWYIYEPSIREHRFGQEAQNVSQEAEIEASEQDSETLDKEQGDTNDDATEDEGNIDEEEQVNKEEISEIQKAWQEWFDKKNKEREERLDQQVYIAPIEDKEETSEITNEYNKSEEVSDTTKQVHVKKISANQTTDADHKQSIDIQKPSGDAEKHTKEEEPTQTAVTREVPIEEQEEAIIRSERVIRPYKGRSYRVYKAIIASIVFIIALTTMISIGAIETPKGPAFTFIEYISGITRD